MKEFAQMAVVGFAKIEGKSVGVVANNPAVWGGLLNCDASDKIARFVRYCDAYNVPLVTFVDVPGFLPGPDFSGKSSFYKNITRHPAV